MYQPNNRILFISNYRLQIKEKISRLNFVLTFSHSTHKNCSVSFYLQKNNMPMFDEYTKLIQRKNLNKNLTC